METDWIGILLLLGGFVLLLIARVPIAFALGLSSLITAFYLDLPLIMIGQRMVNGLNSFTFLAIPFFILVGNIMTEGGISDRLVKFSDVLVGRFRGGLSQGNVVTSTFFGGISGSSVADVASIGSFMIPAMNKQGYPSGYSVSVTVASSIQGVLIPPSQTMIYFALAAGGLPIGKLFLAGYIPGLLLGAALMVVCWFMAKRHNYPHGRSYGWREGLLVMGDASIGLFTIVIIIGGILAGVFTVTESAAIAAVYALFVAKFAYRSLSWSGLSRILSASLSSLTMVIAIIMMSAAFGFLLSFLQIPSLLASGILSLSENPIFVMLAINLLLLSLGSLMDMGVLVLLLTPIILPIVEKIGVDPIHFGVIMILNLGIGLATPPVGVSLLVGCGIGRIKLETATRSLIPFYIVMMIVLMLVTFIPALSMTLPNMLG